MKICLKKLIKISLGDLKNKMVIIKNSLDFALGIAEHKHACQLDKRCNSYIDHINAVVASCKSKKEKIVGALHDLIEDTDLTLDLLKEYFDQDILDAIDAITHRKNEKRLDYLKRVKANKLALAVKKADVIHNASRLENLKGTPDYDRLAHKYLETMIVIFGED